jgi:hypothetical protein
MFNFKELDLDRREDAGDLSSFVGIRRNPQNNKLEFRLPKGFDNFPEKDFNATKDLFFKMYRTFKKFEKDKTRPPIDERPARKDNIEKMGNAYRFMDKDDNPVVLYSKISVIENLLEAHKDLALNVIERRVGRDEKIDYAKIDQYLHKAIYLPNDVIYLDEMELPRHVLRYESATIIDLFCFILHELKKELDQEKELDERVKELSHRFKEQHLNHDQSLFNEETFESTIITLKDSLDEIDKITAYKDEDYWRLYEAIECFLYGELDMQKNHEDGIFWGIQDFWSIWEDMCNTYAFNEFGIENIIYADTNIKFNGENVANSPEKNPKIFKKEDFENPFFIEFQGYKRWMRPDLIRESFNFNGNKNKWIKSFRLLKRYNGDIDFSIQAFDKNNKSLLLFCNKLKKYECKKSSDGIHSFQNCPITEIEKCLDVNLCEFVLLDWKYREENYFLKDSYGLKDLKKDITKQLCYEFCLADKYSSKNIESQFVFPFFFSMEKDIGDVLDKDLYSRLRDNKIKVFKANFQLIQDVYLK